MGYNLVLPLGEVDNLLSIFSLILCDVCIVAKQNTICKCHGCMLYGEIFVSGILYVKLAAAGSWRKFVIADIKNAAYIVAPVKDGLEKSPISGVT